MGMNTTVVVLNDALHHIEKDVEFGKKLSLAIREASMGGLVDVNAGCSYGAAKVIETHHADYFMPILVGGNTGRVLTTDCVVRWDCDDDLKALKKIASSLGYRLVKKKT